MEDTYYVFMDDVKEQLTEKALTYIEVWELADFLSMPKLANYHALPCKRVRSKEASIRGWF